MTRMDDGEARVREEDSVQKQKKETGIWCTYEQFEEYKPLIKVKSIQSYEKERK